MVLSSFKIISLETLHIVACENWIGTVITAPLLDVIQVGLRFLGLV